jgi:N-acetylmuramoyl-L-alanine amidase
MSVKRTRGKRGFAGRVRSALGRLLKPHNAFPCVGLVVLGGCLTMIAVPDEPVTEKAPRTAERSQTGLPTIVIDPGHGGRDEGTKWHGVAEKDMTLDIAGRVETLLKTAGFPTLLTRRDNTYISLEDRVRQANALDDALFVSIHMNSDSSGSASTGVETYYAREKAPPNTEWTWVGFFNKPESVENDTSEVLAGAIQAAITTRTEAKNRGIRSSNYYVVHHTKHPAVLVECGFISNLFELQLLLNADYRDRIAEGVVEGVMSYQKLRSKPNRSPSQPRLALLERR